MGLGALEHCEGLAGTGWCPGAALRTWERAGGCEGELNVCEQGILPCRLPACPHPKLEAWHLLDGFLLTAPTPRVWRAHRLQGILVAFALWRQHGGHSWETGWHPASLPPQNSPGGREQTGALLRQPLWGACPTHSAPWLAILSASRTCPAPLTCTPPLTPGDEAPSVCLSPGALAWLPETHLPLPWTDGSQAPGHVTLATSHWPRHCPQMVGVASCWARLAVASEVGGGGGDRPL